ncbi:MAG: hypothetical protein COT21_02920 [Hadesarchaea archaeon CG08_land_8_20_14_0_20_51_8]|nr:MAG: hypothetical protein COT21_02920 [Hadesarchaea archaeon CG08_land_8_20_14_0_20_51_8]
MALGAAMGGVGTSTCYEAKIGGQKPRMGMLREERGRAGRDGGRQISILRRATNRLFRGGLGRTVGVTVKYGRIHLIL